MFDFEVFGTAVPYVWLTDPDGMFGYEIVFLHSGQVFARAWQVGGAGRNISIEDMVDHYIDSLDYTQVEITTEDMIESYDRDWVE